MTITSRGVSITILVKLFVPFELHLRPFFSGTFSRFCLAWPVLCPTIIKCFQMPMRHNCHWARVYRLCWCISISVWMPVFVCRVWISITRVCAAAKAGQESRPRHWLEPSLVSTLTCSHTGSMSDMQPSTHNWWLPNTRGLFMNTLTRRG